MPFSPRIDPNFYGNALQFITSLEQSSQFDGQVHNDGRSIPTIGYGYALIVQNASNRWDVGINEINQAFATAGMAALTRAQEDSLRAIAQYLNAGNTASAQAELERLRSGDIAIPGISTTQAEQLFRFAFDRNLDQVKVMFKKHLNNDADGEFLYSSLLGTTELIAIGSLGYNNPGKLIGSALTQALWNNDRAEAYYEIAYNSNGGDPSLRNSTANRRYKESNLFGLYDETPTEADYKAAYRMLTRHKTDILGADGVLGGKDGYEDLYPPPEAGMGVFWQLKEARDYLLSQYDQGVSIPWSNILVGENPNTTYYRDTDDDVLLGNDINPSFANELIFGESGNDVLQGNLGDDVLYGGTGVDIYKYRPGDGNDIIIDSSSVTNDSGGDGKGVILYGPDSQARALAVGLRKSTDPAGQYKSPDNTIIYQISGADLTITTPGGTITVKDFNQNNNDLNIRLIDLPLEPPVDLAPGPNQGTSYSDYAGTPDFVDLNGDGNNDIGNINGTSGAEVIHGLTGNDYIDGHGGADRLYGDEGHDTIYFYSPDPVGNALADGGPGHDVIFGESGGDNHFIGGSNGDPLDEADLIVSYQGNDHLEGGYGNDLLIDYLGADILEGGKGDDYLYGNLSVGYVNSTVPNAWTITPVLDVINGVQFANNVYTFPAPQFTGLGWIGFFPASDNKGDVLLGGAGNDYLMGGTGDDLLDAGATEDSSSNTNILFAGLGNDLLNGGAGGDWLLGDGGDDILIGAGGDDTLWGDEALSPGGVAGNDYLDGGAGDDKLNGHGGDDVLLGGAENDTMFGGTGGDSLYGEDGNDWLQGGDGSGIDGNDALFGGAGDDWLWGEEGDDTLSGSDGDDVLVAGSGSDTLAGGDGLDLYVYNLGDGVDTLVDAGINTLRFGAGIGIGSLQLALGSLEIKIRGTDDAIHIENFNPDDPYAGSGITRFEFANGAALTYEQLLNLGFDIAGTGEDDVLVGTTLTDRLAGYGGNDILIGKAGNDVLDGGAGADRMLGGSGDDEYLVDDTGDTVAEDVNAGRDRVRSWIDYTLTDNVEELVLETGALAGTGNALANTIMGNSGNNTLDGGTGADNMAGGAGDDAYIVDDVADMAIEQDGAGTDSVQASVSYTLTANVENLTLTGTADINGTGNSLDNLIVGNAANNVLSGLDGADSMAGGAGSDTYVVDNTADMVTESLDEGSDTVESSIGYTLTANVENLTLTGIENLAGTGNELDNVIRGNDAASVLYGLAGADTLLGGTGADRLDGGFGTDVMQGGAGSDTYVVDEASDQVIETDPYRWIGGTDTVESSIDYTLGANVENLTLTGIENLSGTGNELDNVIRGNDGNNVLSGLVGDDSLDGGAGADFMTGGIGNDAYTVDDAGDVTFENADEGIDEVYSFVTHMLGANLENLYLIGGDPIDGTGNALDNTIEGNAADNVLSGEGGADTLYGNGGNDTLLGGDGNDTLEGGWGADWMAGGAGDDNYFVEDYGDVVIEAAGEGVDWVESSVSFTLGENVDNLRLVDDGYGYGYYYLSGYGNGLDNILIGTDYDNMLSGAGGNDWIDAQGGDDELLGGDGDDYLYGGDDAIIETYDGGEWGWDGGEWGYGGCYVTPNDDYIAGGAGNDTIDGGSGNDTLLGEEGDDYLFGGDDGLPADVCDGGEWGWLGSPKGGALDGGEWGFGGAYYANPNDDYLDGGVGLDILDGGTGDDTLLGGEDADQLYGSSGYDLLDGGLGIDFMAGGQGDDVYYVDGYAEVIILPPSPGGGNGGGVPGSEDRGCDDDDDLHAKGNEGLGNGEDAPPPGHDSNWNDGDGTSPGDPDRRDGGRPEDISDAESHGSSSDDTGDHDDHDDDHDHDDEHDDECDDDCPQGDAGVPPVLGNGAGPAPGTQIVWHTDEVVEQAAEGYDVVYSSVTFTLPANVEELYLIGTAAIDATGNDLDNWISGNDADNVLNGGVGADYLLGNGGNDTLDGGTGADWMNGGAGNDMYVVDDLADVVFEGMDGGTDTVRTVLNNYVLGANVENLVLADMATEGTGNTADNLMIGNGVNNVLRGMEGNDALYGVAGDDALDGGEGNDALYGGEGNDTLLGGAGDDVLHGGNGCDTLDGGEGADTLYGGHGNDTLNGMAGNDLLYGGDGDDRLDGGDGDDILYGCDGEDVLAGGAGNDVLYGGEDDDALDGGAGDDVLQGGEGENLLAGGAGNDTLLLDEGENTILFGRGDGQDLLTRTDATRDRHELDNEILLGPGIDKEDLWLERLGTDLRISLLGTQDSMTIEGWYSNHHKPIEEIKTSSGDEIEAKQIELLVQAMATFSPIPGSGNPLPTEMPEQLQPVLAAAWET